MNAQTFADGRVFIRDFIAYARRRAVAACALIAVAALLEGVGIVLLVPVLGLVVQSDDPQGGRIGAIFAFLTETAGARTPLQRLTLLLAVFAALMLARGAVIFARDLLLARLQFGFVESHRRRMGRLLAGSSWEVVMRLRHAGVTDVMGSEAQRLGVATQSLLQGVVAVFILVGLGAVAFVLSPALAVVSLLVLVVCSLALAPILSRARTVGEALSRAHLALIRHTTQFLGGIKVALSQNLQARFTAEFESAIERMTASRLAYVRQQAVLRIGATTLAAIAAAAALLFGVAAAVPPTALIAFLLLMTRMAGPAAQIQQRAQEVIYNLPAYAKIRNLETDLARPRTTETAAGVAPSGPIVLRNVSYSYGRTGERAGGVQGVNVRLEPGEVVGIIGNSGAGKTTLADLVTGLISPQAGELTVGGVPLLGSALAAWRGRIGYLCQDSFLLDDTVRSNLLWANENAGETELAAVLRLTGADALVEGMSEGLDTPVGERGILVSGGERQRLALARTMLRRPCLLVLDEATSAIDVAGERDLLQRLKAMDERPTILVIAHRQETLSICDRLLLLEGGRLVSGETRRAS